MKNSWQWVLVIDIHQSLLNLTTFRRLFVGFSGGLDSTVLLHLLASRPTLIKKITAVHINHGLSDNAASGRRIAAAMPNPERAHNR